MTLLDAWALSLFLLFYAGYNVLYVLLPARFGLVTRESRIMAYRLAWYRDVLRTHQPILAIQIVRNLIMAHTFFGTVALLVLGGVFSYLIAHVDLVALSGRHDYHGALTQHPVALKLVSAVLLLLVAFLNFGMGIRVCFNLNFTLAVPGDPDGEVSFPMAMLQRQGRHFILGVRSLYFTGPLFLWMLHPTLLIAGSVGIAAVLFRFDFLKANAVPLPRLEP